MGSAELLPSQRALFDLPEGVCYLNCAYMSPLPRRSLDAGREGLLQKGRPWQITPDDFFTTANAVRLAAAQLFGASAHHISLTPSASYGIAVAARNLPIRSGQRVILLADQYPSNVYAWRTAARQNGAEICTIARPEDGNWTPHIIRQIDERTALAALPQCHWTDGSIIELAKVRDALDAFGAALVLDLTQSLGAMTFDLDRIRPDFAVAAAYKWLLGPYSTGILYSDTKYHSGVPIEEHAYPRRDAVDFAKLVNYRDDFEPGARRFDVGEMANFALLPALLSSLQQINAWGVGAIEASLRKITNEVAQSVQAAGLQVLPSDYRAPHFLGIRFERAIPNDLLGALNKQNVFVSVRGDSLRVTPHLYNDESDIAQFLKALLPFTDQR